MKAFKDKVAVITGAASGIGRALAVHCAQEHMKIVLSDVEEEALLQTGKEMRDSGARVLEVLADVSKEQDVEALAHQTLDAFGGVHLLFNNAGVVGELTSIWRNSVADWEWVLGVNLWGVIHGIRVFVPIMLKQDTQCHIVNTSSLSGITSGPGLGAYKVTKHGVVTLSETLYNELSQKGSKIGVSVLCPFYVSTKIASSDRNRPADSQTGASTGEGITVEKESHRMLRQAVEAGMPPSQIADLVFKAIHDEKFYILSHAESKALIKLRMDDILQERNPTNPMK
jgi:NAD(P)-dependent dehydrogenase (short-subunit alcohol dehydrogenase family)